MGKSEIILGTESINHYMRTKYTILTDITRTEKTPYRVCNNSIEFPSIGLIGTKHWTIKKMTTGLKKKHVLGSGVRKKNSPPMWSMYQRHHLLDNREGYMEKSIMQYWWFKVAMLKLSNWRSFCVFKQAKYNSCQIAKHMQVGQSIWLRALFTSNQT